MKLVESSRIRTIKQILSKVQADNGKFTTHEAVSGSLNSWDSGNEGTEPSILKALLLSEQGRTNDLLIPERRKPRRRRIKNIDH